MSAPEPRMPLVDRLTFDAVDTYAIRFLLTL
jgi:hypothetical protein